MGWNTSRCSLVNTDPSVGLPLAYPSNPAASELIPRRRYGQCVTNAPTAAAPPIKSTRILVATLAGGLVIFGIALYFELPSGDYPPVWVPWALGGLAVISHLLSRTVGFNLRPVPAGTLPADAMKVALTTFQTSTILRFALGEVVAIVAIILCFAVSPQTWMTYLIGGVLAVILLAVNVWPRAAIISKVQEQLDREGGQSLLADALYGLAPGTSAAGVISD